MTTLKHEPNCGCEAYACKLRRKGIALSSAATPTRTQNRPFRPGPKFNSWEKGVAGEHRADGSFMPYLNEHGSPIGLKPFSENRREFEQTRSRQMSGAGVDV